MADAKPSRVKSESVFKDIQRYFCEYCGICRSKKSIILAHIQHYHEDVIDVVKAQCGEGKGKKIGNMCDECGANFRKPAYLKQHMHSHLIEAHRMPVDAEKT